MRVRKGWGWGQRFAFGAVLPFACGILLLYSYGSPSLDSSQVVAIESQVAVSSEALPSGEPMMPASRYAAAEPLAEPAAPADARVFEPQVPAVETPPAVLPPAEAEEAADVFPQLAPATAPAPAQRRSSTETKTKYGFYLHVYSDPAAVIYQVREVKKHFPDSPIYVMSDGGHDFSALCEQEGCTFMLCPPANDRWHPWPFFRRLYDAAVSLNTEFVIMLEPDNTIHGPIKRTPDADAGGLLVNGRSFGLGKYVERLARERVPGFKWTPKSMSSGLCGGAYFRAEAILDALSDENMMKLDWNYIGDKGSKEIFSSDFAMQYAFAARGWKIAPWEDAAQMDRKKDEPLTGAKDSAFRHYCSCYPGGKPTYNLKLQKQDRKLFKDSPYQMTSGPYSSSVCQVCYNYTRYVKLWGSDKCTNRIPFYLSEKLLKRHHPDLSNKPCDLPWLCEPGKMRERSSDAAEPTAAPPDPNAVYTLLDDASSVCPEGTKALEDVDQCKAATQKLGKKLAYDEDVYQENDPRGCIYRVPDHDVVFNAAEEGQENSNRRLICRDMKA